MKKEVLFNSYDGRKTISIRIDVQGKELMRYDLPVAAVSPDGVMALSYNYNRLALYAKGYGYENGTDEEADVMIPKRHGLSRFDLQSGASRRLFSVSDIAAIQPDATMDNAFHYFTHCLFSPSGKRFVFYHRWIRDKNFVRTRMFSCDVNGENLFLFPSEGMVSHIGWKDDSHIMAYCITSRFGAGYTLYEDGNKEYSRVGAGSFTSDGHPMYSPVNNRWFITDTYPDRFRLSSLILYDCQKESRIDLARLRQPLQFRNELRCDLHPRWNRKGTQICFDSAHTGVRSLCVLDIGEILSKADG